MKPRANQNNLQSALSLIEMMVTVALLTLIIVGLVAMFEQTRKAFTSGLANVDYQDSGRVALDIIARDVQQMAPANAGIVYANSANTFAGTNTLNFYTDFEPNVISAYVSMSDLNGDLVTNVMQRLLFVTQYNQTWNAIGYRVVPDKSPAGTLTGAGTLYQYRAAGPAAGVLVAGESILDDFLADTNAYSPVIDGVVGFKVRAYDPNGNEILPQNTPGAYVTATASPSPTSTAYPALYPTPQYPGGYGYAYMLSNNVEPAYVQIELTVMESKTLDRYRSMGGANAQSYWTNHIGQMHVFKQRVSIPSLDRTAFP